MQDVIEKGEKQPNLTIGILVSILVVFITVIFRVLFGGKKPTVSFRLYSVFDLFCALFKLSIFFFTYYGAYFFVGVAGWGGSN